MVLRCKWCIRQVSQCCNNSSAKPNLQFPMPKSLSFRVGMLSNHDVQAFERNNGVFGHAVVSTTAKRRHRERGRES